MASFFFAFLLGRPCPIGSLPCLKPRGVVSPTGSLLTPFCLLVEGGIRTALGHCMGISSTTGVVGDMVGGGDLAFARELALGGVLGIAEDEDAGIDPSDLMAG